MAKPSGLSSIGMTSSRELPFTCWKFDMDIIGYPKTKAMEKVCPSSYVKFEYETCLIIGDLEET